jgi:hypothetical protein
MTLRESCVDPVKVKANAPSLRSGRHARVGVHGCDVVALQRCWQARKLRDMSMRLTGAGRRVHSDFPKRVSPSGTHLLFSGQELQPHLGVRGEEGEREGHAVGD